MRQSLLLAATSMRGRRRLGLLATVVILFIASIGMSAGLTVTRQGAPLLDAAADDAHVAHLVLYGDAGALVAAAADESVVAHAGPFATVGSTELVVGEEPIPIQMTALDDPAVDVNRPPVVTGRWAASPDEIVLDRSLAADAGLAPGDTAAFRDASASLEFTVVGTAVNFTDCFYPMCDPGRVWVTSDGLDRIGGSADRFDQMWLRFADAAEADPFVERLAGSALEGIQGTDSWLDTRDDFLALDRIFGSFISVFGAFVLACAAVVVAGSTAMRIVTRRREIGLLGSIGCGPREIAASLVIENVALGVVAASAGWALAGLAVPSLQVGIGATLGPQDPSWSLLALVVSVVVVSVVLAVATLVPAARAARRPVTDVLRDVPPSGASRLSRRMARVPRRLELIGIQEAASQPTRSALAALAIGVAVVGTITSIGFIGAIEGVADEPARQGDPWDLTLAPGDVDVTEVERAIAATGGVDRWYGEVERRSTLDEGAFLSVAVGGEMADAGYHVAEGRVVRGPGEAIAGYGFLQRFDRQVGDTVEILVGTTPLSLEIVGWYRETEDSGEILRFPLEDLSRAEPVEPEVFRLSVGEGAEPDSVVAELSRRLDDRVNIAAVDTGIDDMQPFFMALRLIAAILVVMAGINLLSTLLTANREAAGRTGVELAIGFTPRQLVGQGAVAGLTMGVIACVVGVPLGLGLFRFLADGVSSGIGAGPGWMPLPSIVPLLGLVGGTLLVTAGLGALSMARLAQRPASDLIRFE